MLKNPFMQHLRLVCRLRRAPPASVRVVRVSLRLFCFVLRLLVVALPAVRFRTCPALLPAPDPVLHVSVPVRRCAVADARLDLA